MSLSGVDEFFFFMMVFFYLNKGKYFLYELCENNKFVFRYLSEFFSVMDGFDGVICL